MSHGGILDWDLLYPTRHPRVSDPGHYCRGLLGRQRRRHHHADAPPSHDDDDDDPWTLLQRAAHHGQATAQYLWGQAQMSGRPGVYNKNKLPLVVADDWWYVPPSTQFDSDNDKNHQSGSISTTLQQQQEQQARGMLWYQMAAIGGNVDAMITLGHRIEEQPGSISATASSSSSTKSSGSTTELSTCQRSIPYFASAAHHIIDTLMNDPYSRGQIVPFQDKHVLYKIHVHGGNYPVQPMSIQDLDQNKPYESMETIQFYKIKAATLLQQQNSQNNKSPQSSFFSMKSWWSANQKGIGANSDHSQNDATATAAAYTLGRLYHLGARGMAPNTTMALQYYVAAAQAGHWEAAGQAGWLYFYNVGFDIVRSDDTHEPNHGLIQRNREEAYRLFQLGARFELSGCQLRYQLQMTQQQQKLAGQQHNHERVFPCDSESLNGLGLIHLFGLSSKNITINIPLATRYFELARDQGNSNAAYHLAMMKLGWRTHYSINKNHTTPLENLDEMKVLDIDNGIEDDVSTSSAIAKMKAEQLFPIKSSKDDEKGKLTDDKHLSILEYKTILTDLASAAKNGHLLARHRLAMIYENGIRAPSEDKNTIESKYDMKKGPKQKYMLTPECEIANMHYKWIVDNASPMKAQRMRKAYLHYMAGNYADSLRYYLYVAEMGYEIAQLNAAFLLEQGVCLGLNDVDCAKASVRLWKVVAKRDHAEANMRVGDFYYYGRFRTLRDRSGGGTNSIPVGPWGWVDYIIYPEKHLLPLLWKKFKQQIIDFSEWEPLSILDVSKKSSDLVSSRKHGFDTDEPTCSTGSDEGTCSAGGARSRSRNDSDVHRRRQQQLDDDLATAAHYYQLAADRTGTARAHFNLGFMYEWGLGLKQDFPLAKRQYDLAMTTRDHEADLPVLLALSALNLHEYFVKLKLSWEKYWQRTDVNDDNADEEKVKVEL